MIPMGTNTDQWIAAVASYVRNSFGNSGLVRHAADVARVRAATDARKTMWTPEELEASVPQLLLAQPILEADSEPQFIGGCWCVDIHDLEQPRAAAARNVVPGRIAASRLD